MARNEPVRIILDTNWYISFLITGRPVQMEEILIDKSIELIISEKLIEEFQKVITYKKFRKYFSKSRARKYFRYIILRCTFTDVKSSVLLCRDPKDNYLLSLAKDSSAHFLVTGDGDLKDLKHFENTIICTFPDFLNKYMKK